MMNSMIPYNQNINSNTPKENESLLSFSFSLDRTTTATTEGLLDSVRANLQDILNDRFGDYERRRIDGKINRLNFACPYCGDSHADAHKKRGNVYISGCYYKCYNCGIYRSIEGFLKDYKKELNTDELILAREINASGKKTAQKVDPMMLHDTEELIKWSVERSAIEEKFKLAPIDRAKIYPYLKKRLQPDMSKFSWSQEKQQLYIFHIIPNTTRVLGFQIRNFVSTPKYMTYKLSRIYEELGMEVTDNAIELDEISTSFGILEIDITRPVTVFEGPLDSFLYKNSIATCSSNIDSPIDLSTLRYLYDYDKAGKEAAMQKLNAGMPVFLWKKFFHDTGIDEPVKKMDLTDLLVLSKRKNFKLPKLSNFFSSDKYDIYWI